MPETDPSITPVKLASGWSIRRDAKGQELGLLITDIKIALLDKPGTEVRVLEPSKPSYRGIGISLLNGAEVRYQTGLHATTTEQAEDTVLESVPTLTSCINGRITDVYSSSNDKGERFLTVNFDFSMRQLLQLERNLVLGALDRLMQPRSQRPWRSKPLDFTLAYFSQSSSDSAIRNSEGLVRRRLPIPFTFKRALFHPPTKR